MDHAEKAAAVAAKLSQTLLGLPKPSPASYVLERQPVRSTVSTPASFFGLPEPESINVPSERVGQIIGKGGMKIREIQEKAQVRMDIAKESNPTTPHLREIKLTGSKEGIQKCKKLLEELYAEVDIRVGGSPDRTIEIPISVVGLIVGRGGETIRRIIEETKCIIQIQKNEDWRVSRRNQPKPGNQNVYLKGDTEALDKAEKTIRDLVAGAGERRRPPQNYQFGGHMPPAGMPYPQPYGMPPTSYGNNYAPGQNYAPPQPYPPGQMYAPQMYNQHPNQHAQGSLPQPFPQAQQYIPQGQPHNPQAQAYLPSQAPYNPAGNIPTPVENQALPQQMNGYGGLGPTGTSCQTPYNPGQPSISAQFVPNLPNQTSYQNPQPNQIPGGMNGQFNQIPGQPNYQPNLLPGQQNTQINTVHQQQNSQYSQNLGQQNVQQSYTYRQPNGQPPQIAAQANGQSNQLSAIKSSQPTQSHWEKSGQQNLNQMPPRQLPG